MVRLNKTLKCDTMDRKKKNQRKTKEKHPFLNSCKHVLSILNSEKKGFNEICDNVRDSSGIKISRTTVKKCLDYLVFTSYIDTVKTKGRGRPADKYLLSDMHDIFKFDQHIKATRKINNSEPFLSDKTAYGFEATHHTHIENATLMLNQSLITALYEYSNSTDRNKACERYNAFLQTQLLPCLLDLQMLVKPDMVMSEETYNILIGMYTPVSENRQTHSLQNKLPEEMIEDFSLHCKQRLQQKDTLQVYPEKR